MPVPSDIVERLAQAPRLAVLCEFDDALAVLDRKRHVAPLAGVGQALNMLGARANTRAAIVSDRALHEPRELFVWHGEAPSGHVVELFGDDGSAAACATEST